MEWNIWNENSPLLIISKLRKTRFYNLPIGMEWNKGCKKSGITYSILEWNGMEWNIWEEEFYS